MVASVVARIGVLLASEVHAARRPSEAVSSHALIQQNARSYRRSQMGMPSFVEFLQENSRIYEEASEEYQHRRALYDERIEQVSHQNSKPNRLWDAGINHLSDWTDEELGTLRGWRGFAKHAKVSGLSLRQTSSGVSVSEHIWDHEVPKASNQGSCGSCWAVATAKMAETNHLIHTNQSRSFSAQELVDCTPNPHECGGTGGCQGATVELAMLYMMNQGCKTTEQTPYSGSTGTCANPPGQLVTLQLADTEMTMDELTAPGLKVVTGAAARQIHLLNWERLPVNEDAGLMTALLEGTVAVSVSGQPWSSYSSGIFDGCSRDAVIDHAVVAIGFGVDKHRKRKFWSILNSWGSAWGEKGRIRLLRTDEEHCGTDRQPEVGTGCKGGPSSVHVCGMCGILYDSVIARFGTHLTSDDF